MTSLEEYLTKEQMGNIQKIRNSTLLITKFEKAHSEEGMQDIMAEIDVGLHHIQKDHNVEYEPNELSEPPEYRITYKDTTFFVEVKRVREHELIHVHHTIISDLDERWKKLSIPYTIVFTINDAVLKDISQNKKIIHHICDCLKNQYSKSMNERCDIHLDGMLLGYFRAFNGMCTIGDGIIVCGGLEENLGAQLKKANKKMRPVDKPYIVVLKVPVTLSDDEIVRALFGKPTAWMNKNSGVLGQPYRIDKRLGHKTEYHKISAVLFYRNEFKPDNISMCINDTADAKIKVDPEFLRKYL